MVAITRIESTVAITRIESAVAITRIESAVAAGLEENKCPQKRSSEMTYDTYRKYGRNVR